MNILYVILLVMSCMISGIIGFLIAGLFAAEARAEETHDCYLAGYQKGLDRGRREVRRDEID